MAWEGVITNVGQQMLQRVASGETLTITAAKTGTGIVPSADMKAQTSLQSEVGTGKISKSARDDGVFFSAIIESHTSSYTMKEVGIFANVGSGEPFLFILLQNADGIAIPNVNDFPEFTYTLTSFVALENTDNITITIDPTAYVTNAELEDAYNELDNKIEGVGGELSVLAGVVSQKAEKSEAVKNITRSGTTFTATRANGTTFTFTQQDNDTKYSAGTGLSQSGTTFSVSKGNASEIINLLDTGTANTTADDYIVTQYASGGTDHTEFIRRPAAHVVNGTLVKAALGTNATHGGAYLRKDGTWVAPPDTKNTAGSTNTSSKIFLVGATSQAANPQTYSHDTAYVGTDGCLYSGGAKVLTAHQSLSGKKDVQTAVSDPSASGTSLTFIKSISQNAQGVITPAKSTVSTMGAATDSAAGTAGLVPAPAKGKQGSYLRGDGTWSTPTNTTYSEATSSAYGLIKVGYTASGKNYPVRLSSGKAYVNVPWTDTNTTYSEATDSAYGLVKVGYTASGKNYPVQLSSGKMYVNVPWTDTNTTYSNMTAATSSAAGKAGLVPAPAAGKQASFLRGDGTWATPTNTTYSTATADTLGLVKIGYTASGKNYPVQLSSGKMYVNVPWTDTNTTYSAMTGATADAAGTTGLVPAPTKGKQASYLRGDGTWAVPTNTTYSNMTAATASADGKAGLVPAPGAGKQASFLRGDGTWATPTNTTYSNMTGATSSAAGKAGLVPAPGAGKQASFLRGDGTWSTPTNTTYSTATSDTLGLVKVGFARNANQFPVELAGGKMFVQPRHFYFRTYSKSFSCSGDTYTSISIPFTGDLGFCFLCFRTYHSSNVNVEIASIQYEPSGTCSVTLKSRTGTAQSGTFYVTGVFLEGEPISE